MTKLSDSQIAHYFHRSYTAVDGLWFMKVEEQLGFDAALEIDNEVWKVMSKIQARNIKELINTGQGINALCRCLEKKFVIEGFTFKTVFTDKSSGFEINISDCPWYNLMVKSNRTHLAIKIGDRICNTEYTSWANEFDKNIRFEFKQQICCGFEECILKFST